MNDSAEIAIKEEQVLADIPETKQNSLSETKSSSVVHEVEQAPAGDYEKTVSLTNNDTTTTISETSKKINIDELEQISYTVSPLASNSTAAENANIVRYSGNIEREDQEDWYYFQATNEGYYRLDISGIQNGTYVTLYLYDELGNILTYDSYCNSGDGLTGKALEAGKNYSVRVKQEEGYSAYNLSIGMQKASIDLTGYTELCDSVEYTDQRNIYYFTVPVTGRYRFDLSEVYSDTDVELLVFDSLGDTVTYDSYCTNGGGVTCKSLQAGATYEIQIRQDNGFSGYRLNIGYQKNTTDITNYSIVKDSVEYTDQCNIYTFTVPVDGRYRFELSEMSGGADVELYLYNHLEELVASDNYCMNGAGITVKDLKAGETYHVQIRQDNGFSSYTLSIGKQKETVEVDNKTSISDSVEYVDQRNVYSLIVNKYGDITISISGLESGVYVEAYVYDDLENVVVSDTYFSNGDSIEIKEVTMGEHYEIQVRQDEGMSGYTLNIE